MVDYKKALLFFLQTIYPIFFLTVSKIFETFANLLVSFLGKRLLVVKEMSTLKYVIQILIKGKEKAQCFSVGISVRKVN